MTSPVDLARLERKRRLICDQLAAVGEFHPGTLTRRHRKCGKSNCHCTDLSHPGHSPS